MDKRIILIRMLDKMEVILMMKVNENSNNKNHFSCMKESAITVRALRDTSKLRILKKQKVLQRMQRNRRQLSRQLP